MSKRVAAVSPGVRVGAMDIIINHRVSTKTSFYFIVLLLHISTVVARQFTYTPNGDNVPCVNILADFTFRLEILNETSLLNNTGTSKTLAQDNVVNVSGGCLPPEIIFSFYDQTKVTFLFQKNSDGNVELNYTLHFILDDQTNSVDGNTLNISVSETLKIERSLALIRLQDSGCGTYEFDTYENNLSGIHFFLYVNISIDSLNISSDYINTSLCLAPTRKEIASSSLAAVQQKDLSSAASSTVRSGITGSVSSTPPSPDTTNTVVGIKRQGAPVSNYTVREDNVTCIYLQGAFTISIDYTLNSTKSASLTTRTVQIEVPIGSNSTGSCNLTHNSENLAISFLDGWTLNVIFTLDPSSPSGKSLATDLVYGITNVSLTYVMDGSMFPNSTITSNSEETVFPDSPAESSYPKKTKMRSFYKCNSDTKFKLGKSVTVHVTDLKFKAFNSNGGSGSVYAGDAEICAADQETDQVIPIVVGCILGGVVLLMAVVHYTVACVRRRKQKQLSL